MDREGTRLTDRETDVRLRVPTIELALRGLNSERAEWLR